MRRYRWLISVFAAGIIVFLGVYLQRKAVFDGGRSPEGSKQQSQTDSERRSEKWTVAPEGTLQLSEVETDSSSDTDSRSFTLPGRLNFPGGNPERVRLKVVVYPSPSSAADGAEAKNSKQSRRDLLKASHERKALTYELRTDSRGRFTLEGAPPGLYHVSANDTRWFGRTEEPLVERPGRIRPVEFSVRRSARLEGRVLDTRENPIEGAKIIDKFTGRTVTTDGNGRFEFKRIRPDRDLDRIHVRKEGYASRKLDSLEFETARTRTKTVILERNATLRVKGIIPDGSPAEEAAVLLVPAGSGQEEDRTENDETRHGSLDEQGETTLAGLRPGTYRAKLSHPKFLSRERSVDLPPGDERRLTLSARERLPVTISLVREGTDRPIPLGMPPRVQVFDENGNELRPGFVVDSIKSTGVIEGKVHPDMSRAVVTLGASEAPNDDRLNFRFRPSDLPDVTIPVPRSALARLAPGQSNLDRRSRLIVVPFETSINPDAIQRSQIEVIDRGSGEMAIARGGTSNTLTEPIPLAPGEYALYGSVRTDEAFWVLYENIDLETSEKQVRVRPRVPAELKGTIRTEQGTAENLRVGLSFRDQDRSGEEETPNYYPLSLRARPDASGDFTLNRVPPGVQGVLEVTSVGQGRNESGSETVLERIPITTPEEGATRRIPSVTVRFP